jgi:hypothetical protein
MNDIERLIARLPRPLPSPDLDARIAELTSQPVRSGATRARLRRFSVIAACTACGGLLGFVLGRQSVVPTNETLAVTVRPAAQMPPGASAPERVIVNVQIPQNDALARFVMPPKRIEGLFGPEPLEHQPGPSQLE